MRAVFLHTAGSLAHASEFSEARFDGLKLNAIAAQLHLRINTAMIIKVTFAVAMHEIACAVDASQAWMHGKLFSGQFGAIAIAARQARAA